MWLGCLAHSSLPALSAALTMDTTSQGSAPRPSLCPTPGTLHPDPCSGDVPFSICKDIPKPWAPTHLLTPTRALTFPTWPGIPQMLGTEVASPAALGIVTEAKLQPPALGGLCWPFTAPLGSCCSPQPVLGSNPDVKIQPRDRSYFWLRKGAEQGCDPWGLGCRHPSTEQV